MCQYLQRALLNYNFLEPLRNSWIIKKKKNMCNKCLTYNHKNIQLMIKLHVVNYMFSLCLFHVLQHMCYTSDEIHIKKVS